MGFNGDSSHLNFLSKTKELEVGLFLAQKGEQVKYIEGQNCPDLLSGLKSYNKVWEVKTIYDSPLISRIFIEGNKIINEWDRDLEVIVHLSIRLSGFLPKKINHSFHRTVLEKALVALDHFDLSSLDTESRCFISTSNIVFEIKESSTGRSGITTIREGGIEQIAHLVGIQEELMWVEILRQNIINKSSQLINDLIELENQNKIIWNDPHYNLVALVTNTDIFHSSYLQQACFGTFNIHSNDYIEDNRITKLDSTNPWKEYIEDKCYDSSGRIVREPAGAFFSSKTEELHGVLLISTNRRPLDSDFIVNPLVQTNNDQSIINWPYL